MFVVLIGLPGSGKGTQCEMLKKNDNIIHISPGEILRKKLAGNDKDVEGIRSLINSGTLLSDDFIMKLVENNLLAAKINSESNDSSCVVFDGIPRTLEQAKMLDDLLMNNYKIQIEKVVFLQISKRLILKRLSMRVVCTSCNVVSSLKSATAQFKCENCGSINFKRRSDDNFSVIRRRIKVDALNWSEIYTYYLKRDGVKCLKLSGNGNKNIVYRRLKSFLFADKI